MDPESRSGEIRTGLFVAVALAICILATLWIAGAKFSGEQKTYEVWMRDAGGVRVGDQVRTSGVEIGRVEALQLKPGEEWPVIFEVTLDAQITLHEGSRARFAQDSLLGGSFLAIETGDPQAPVLPDGQPIRGLASVGVDQALARVDEVAVKAITLMDEFSVLMQDLPALVTPVLERVEVLLSEENVADATGTLKALRSALEETGPLLRPLIGRIDGLAGQLESGVENMPELTSEAQTLLTELRQAVGPDGERLVDLLDSADQAMSSADRAFGVVGDNTGDIHATVQDLRQAAANLRSLSQSLKERPDRLLRPGRRPDRQPGQGERP